MVIFGLDLLDRPRLWKALWCLLDTLSISRTYPDGLKAQSPHSAVGHLDDPGDLCVGSIHLDRRRKFMHPRLGLGESQCLQALLDSVFGHVVPEEEDGQSSIESVDCL